MTENETGEWESKTIYGYAVLRPAQHATFVTSGPASKIQLLRFMIYRILSIEVGAPLLLIACLWINATDSAAIREKFMSQCIQDHKQYECDAMYRGNNYYSNAAIGFASGAAAAMAIRK